MDHSTTPQDTPLKFCSKCLEWKPATTEYFSRQQKKSRDGLQSWCKSCAAEYNRKWIDANPEYNRKYREANAEQLAEYGRNYYVANAGRKAENYSKWYAANLERRRAQVRAYYAARRRRKRTEQSSGDSARKSREWRAANRDAYLVIHHRRRARKRSAEGSHTAADIRAQYKAQRGKCYYCGAKVGETYHIDHVVPLARGGSDGPENLVIACAPCNLSKRDKLPHEWPQGGRLL